MGTVAQVVKIPGKVRKRIAILAFPGTFYPEIARRTYPARDFSRCKTKKFPFFHNWPSRVFCKKTQSFNSLFSTISAIFFSEEETEKKMSHRGTKNQCETITAIMGCNQEWPPDGKTVVHRQS